MILKNTINKFIPVIRDLIKKTSSIKKKNIIDSYIRNGMIPWTDGYSEYKYDYIKSVIGGNSLQKFKVGKLPEKYGFRLDERAVEYPWFFSRLKKNEIKILDAGSVLNYSWLLDFKILKHRKIYIATLDYEGYNAGYLKPSYVYEDLRNTSFKDSSFDAICCISTLEHVGMDNTFLYTKDRSKKENEKYAYIKVIKEFSRIIKKKGTLYLTLPYGKFRNHRWFQVFDKKMIDLIINEFKPDKFEKTFFKYFNDQWNFSNEDDCRDGYCFDIHTMKSHEKDYLAFSRCIIAVELVK